MEGCRVKVESMGDTVGVPMPCLKQATINTACIEGSFAGNYHKLAR